MSSLYIVESTDGTFSFTIQPGSVNGPSAAVQSTDLKFVGSGLYGWGQAYVNNFFRLLENFATEEKNVGGQLRPLDATDFTGNPSACYGLNKGINAPVAGQSWFNKTRNELYVYTGTIDQGGTDEWVPASSFAVGTVDPSNDPSNPGYVPFVGQLWYDTASDPYTSPVDNVAANGVLKVFDGASFVDVALPITDKLYPIEGGTLYGGVATGGETSPDSDVNGICINTGSSNGLSLTFKNNNVSHPFTSLYQTDTFGFITKGNNTTGGLLLGGLSENETGIYTQAYAVAPTTSSSGQGVVHIQASKSLGTGSTSLSATENLFTISNAGTNQFLLKGNGDLNIIGGVLSASATVIGNISTNTLSATGVLTCTAGIGAITNNAHLTTKQYVDNAITTALYEPVSGNWHNNGWLRVHTDGGTEVGKYIDFHHTSSGTSSFTTRLRSESTVFGDVFYVTGTSSQDRLTIGMDGGHTAFKGVVDVNLSSASFPHITFTDDNLEADAAYPEGALFASKMYGELGRVHDTKGGLRVRGYFKNGLNLSTPALFLEGIKNDNGQITNTELGAVTINAARFVSDVFQQVVSGDNVLVVSNHTTPLLSVKGDGKVISNGVAVTNDAQLTTKSYVDSVANASLVNFQEITWTPWNNDAISAANNDVDTGYYTIQNHILTRAIQVNGVASFTQLAPDSTAGASTLFYIYARLYRNGSLVDTHYLTSRYNGYTAPFDHALQIPFTLTDSTRDNLNSALATYTVDVRIRYEKSASRGAVTLSGTVKVNSTMYRANI